MGEVYLGLQEGAGGLERFVVIKRIYPQYGEDEHFAGMLLEEARLAASIRHPNVVQIHDIGHDEDGYFLVMEYLSGETLLFLTRTLQARGDEMPAPIACRIVAEVAAGLHCAHVATDPAGHPQPIVHRDVTPSNLIVCFNGVVKIVDFGVAKATMHEAQTRGGVKGKMSYLAPEQLYDKPIDGRTDIFQLGICLHEFLTGARLFKAETDQQRMLAVLQQRIPAPSEIVPSLPKALDDVVLWALERDPELRPATADDFRRELEIAAGELGALSGHDLGGWMRTAFAERLAERNRFERQCVAEMREGRSLSGEMPAVTMRERTDGDGSGGDRSGTDRAGISASGAGPRPDSGSLQRFQSGAFSLIGLSPVPGGTESSGHQSQQSRPPEGTGTPLSAVRELGLKWTVVAIAALALLIVSGILIGFKVGRRSTSEATADQGQGSAGPVAPAPQRAAAPPAAATAATTSGEGAAAAPAPAAKPLTFEMVVSVVPAEAIIELDGVEVGRGSYRATLPVDGTRHVMTVRADGYGSVGLDFTDRPPPSRIQLDPSRATAVRRDGPAPAARPVRRTPPPEAARKRPARQRPRADNDRSEDLGDVRGMSDNPDPWATDPDEREGEKGPEGSE